MRYTRQGPDGYAVRPCAPNVLKPLFETVFAADMDEGWLLVDPAELRSTPYGATAVVQERTSDGLYRELRGVKWFGEWDLVWIGDDREAGERGPARKRGQVLHRIRYEVVEHNGDGALGLHDEGGDVL